MVEIPLSYVNVQKLYKRAMKKWGTYFQLNMVAEECAELIKEVLKLNRKTNGSNLLEVVDEMVDVTIMMEQLTVILEKMFERDDIDTMIRARRTHKLLRLKEMLDKCQD